MLLPQNLSLSKLLLPFLLRRAIVSSFVVETNIRLHSLRGNWWPKRFVNVQQCQSQLNAGSTDAESTSHIANPKGSNVPFWGSNRTKQEIQDFCHRAVFHNSSLTLNMSQSMGATLAADKVTVINSEPPLVIIHDFLSHEECEVLIMAAAHQDLQRSTTGVTQETTDIRTSSTTWLRDEGDGAYAKVIHKNHVLRSFAQRVSRLCGLPPENMENLQIIHYLETQQFDVHTDHLDSFNDLDARGRLATCLVYLNDGYQGGETFFPEYDVSVKANKGSALFFWNTLERPGMKHYEPYMFLNVDTRLRHAGLPVINGVKWACNRWVHPINYGAGVRGL